MKVNLLKKQTVGGGQIVTKYSAYQQAAKRLSCPKTPFPTLIKQIKNSLKNSVGWHSPFFNKNDFVC